MCLIEEIGALRKQLDLLIEQESDYDEILEVSTKLDVLINKYQNQKN